MDNQRMLRKNNESQKILPQIQKEIAFLNMRIDTIKDHHTPNREMLKNFESMLKSREDVAQKIRNPSTLLRISRRLG